MMSMNAWNPDGGQIESRLVCLDDHLRGRETRTPPQTVKVLEFAQTT
jgi:hypothetical protein